MRVDTKSRRIDIGADSIKPRSSRTSRGEGDGRRQPDRSSRSRSRRCGHLRHGAADARNGRRPRVSCPSRRAIASLVEASVTRSPGRHAQSSSQAGVSRTSSDRRFKEKRGGLAKDLASERRGTRCARLTGREACPGSPNRPPRFGRRSPTLRLTASGGRISSVVRLPAVVASDVLIARAALGRAAATATR